MKMKRWHLYLIVTLCFVIVFVAINYKYDRFYRVNGINNDNRALIEQYLSENEQEYLIDNAIPVNQFIQYIQNDDFSLYNYEYYNTLKETKKYTSDDEMIKTCNVLISQLQIQFGIETKNRFNDLIRYDLVNAYLNQHQIFDFNHLTYYQMVKILYADNDYTYIEDTNTYVQRLNDYQISGSRDLNRIFKSMTTHYNIDSLRLLLTTQLPQDVTPVFEVDDKQSLVNDQHFIASYSPKKLVNIEGISRINYTTYLQSDCYEAISEMYKAMYSQIKQHFMVVKGYQSYETLSLINDHAGYNEYQLGTLVKLKKASVSDSQFVQTEIYQWLIQHSYEYGFVLRYPSDKTNVNGHEFDATLFRYVGKTLAKTMHDQNLCLEEVNTSQNEQ